MPFVTQLDFHMTGPGSSLVVLDSEVVYLSNDGREFVVPVGFTCDLASVPRLIRSVSTPWQQSARSGVLHDCGYRWFEVFGIPRRGMDDLYNEALRSDGVSRFRAWLQWSGVRLGGWRAWRGHRAAKEADKGPRPENPQNAPSR